VSTWAKDTQRKNCLKPLEYIHLKITAWRKLLKEIGSLDPQYRESRSRKINLKKLEEAVERRPDVTLSELSKIFDCSKAAVFYALKKIGSTLKKRHFHTLKETT